MKQVQALYVMLRGDSVFLTGSPGAGKTYVLNKFISLSQAQGKQVAVTASTGIAATHIGGTTIHAWSGLGVRDQLTSHDRQWLIANDKLVKRYNNTDILVIDEVSMLHGQRLDMVNQACKLLRQSDAPFGGLQVVLVGDLFQLPPVNRQNDTLDFVHTSATWQELNPSICYLTEQHRQQGGGLLDVLEAMRQGQFDEAHFDLLQQRLQTTAHSGTITRLFAHNVDVESINNQQLAALPGSSQNFAMQSRGAAAKVDQLRRGLLVPENLELKIGAQVMFVVNHYSGKYVNGSRGQVVAFQNNLPVVELLNGKQLPVEPHTWALEEDGKMRAEAVQLPLRLAWAITIHKSQGMSLDAAQIDLSKAFTPGMGYVALSRVRNLEGLYLTGINAMATRLHPQIYVLDEQLRSASQTLGASLPDDPVISEPAPPETPPADPALLTKLKQWRLQRASADQVPPYVIAHNTTLETLAIHQPRSADQLLKLKGFGPKTVDKYGPDILSIIQQVTGQSPAATSAAAAWNPADDQVLLELFRSKMSLTDIASRLEYPTDQVWQRLSDLLA